VILFWEGQLNYWHMKFDFGCMQKFCKFLALILWCCIYYFLGVKQLGHAVDHPHLSSAKVLSKQSCTFTLCS